MATRQATMTKAFDFTDEENVTFYFSNPDNANVYPSLKFSYGTAILSLNKLNSTQKFSNGYVWVLSDTEKNSIYNKFKNNATLNVEIGIYTKIDSTYKYSQITKTFSIVNSEPIMGSITQIYDSNTDVVNITGDNKIIVTDLSNITVEFTAATPQKNATIKFYEVRLIDKLANDYIVEAETLTTPAVTNLGVVRWESEFSIQVVVWDSRGNVNEIEKKIDKLKYWYPPLLGATLKRTNNFENETKIKVDMDYKEIGSNAPSIKYRYKETDGEYNQYSTIANLSEIVLDLDNSKDFQFEFVYKDSFSTEYTLNKKLSKGIFPMFIDVQKNSVGFNGFPKHDKAVDIYGNIYANDFLLNNTEVLWDGLSSPKYPTASQKINLSKKVSETAHGIYLIYYAYKNGEIFGGAVCSRFVPKYSVPEYVSTTIIDVMAWISFSKIATKAVYVYQDKIVGADANNKTGTANGITYDNSSCVLGLILGV